MKIKEIAVDHYGPLRDVRHRPKLGLQVFYGHNESGKTLLIDAILKLLLGKNLRDFKDIDRVPGLPQGRIALVHQGREHIFNGRDLLEKVTGLGSSDLRNVFVIRNKDLQISSQAEYFSRLNDQLTGMEGRRLARLKEIVRNRGRMTRATTDAQLSKSQDFNWIGKKVADAQKLALEIREYLDKARTEQLNALEQRLEDCRRDLDATSRQIQELEAAQAWEEYQLLCLQVEEYAQHSEAAQRLFPYTKTKFLQLQDKASRSKASIDSATESKEKLSQLLPLIAQANTELADAEIQLTSLEERKLFLDNLGQQAQATKPASPLPHLFWGRFGLALLGLAAIALLLAARNTLPGKLQDLPYWALSGAALLLLLDTGLRFRGLSNRRKQDRLIHQGAAAGIMAKTVQELAAAAARERAFIDQARLRQQQKGEKLRTLESEKNRLEEDIRIATTRSAELEQEVKDELQRLAVKDLNQFGERMEQYSLAQVRCDNLHQTLETAFGQTPAQTGDWESLLRQILAPGNPSIPEDAARLAQLRQDKDELIANIDTLQQTLSLHQAELSRFAADFQGLPLEMETGYRLPALFADLEMLEHGASILDLFVSKVTATFDTAVKLMGILEILEAEEQAKTADLVGPHKPVQGIFRTITDAKYTRVMLNSQSNITVETQTGLELPASALSQGTFDQLYLAIRLSLAQELLAAKPGFLILDDAFLCADSIRLEKMLALLAQQAQVGWQILYFTMDERLLHSRYTADTVTRLEPLLHYS